MANLVLAFAELLGGAVILDAAIKGDSIGNVVRGTATQNPIGDSSSSSGSPSAPTSSGTYLNPVPGASTGRIDQGVDYTLSSSGFLAPGRSKILHADASNSGWAGGGYIAAQLLDGPLAGSVYYVAEGVAPAAGITKDKIVAAGTPLVVRVKNPYNGVLGNIEAGWADPSNPTRPLAQSLSGYSGDQSSQALTAGYSFAKFVQAVGGAGGIFQGAGQALAATVKHAFAGATPAGVPYG